MPFGQLRREPFHGFIRMADQAGVGTLLLPEARGHLRIRNLIDSMRPRLEKYGGHGFRHVAGDATASLRRGFMPRMRFEIAGIRFVALEAHLI